MQIWDADRADSHMRNAMNQVDAFVIAHKSAYHVTEYWIEEKRGRQIYRNMQYYNLRTAGQDR